MKMRTAAVLLALFGTAPIAIAQDVMPPDAPPEPAAAPASLDKQQQAAQRTAVRRQGADMRHCLDIKDRRAIIRCAERGRRP